jgi:branched-subunit amino acid ABC-type transport system permease component
MVAAVVAMLWVLVPAAPAAAADPCTPDQQTGCIIGTIKTAAGDPAPGITVTVTAPDGTVASTSTDPDGRWTVAVAEAGDYAVGVDVATLPAGETLRDPGSNPRTVTIELNQQKGALFPLGTPAASPTQATDGSTASPASTHTGSGSNGISSARVWQQLANGLIFGLLLALASVGLSLIYGTTGLSSFSHGEQVTLGALAAYFFVQVAHLPLLVGALLAVGVGALSGWAQDAGMWHQLRRRHVGLTQQMIVTIGLSMALQYLFQFFFGGGRHGIVTTSSTSVAIGHVTMSSRTIVSAVIAIVVLAGVAYFLMFTRLGQATRAVSDNPALAAASGIGVERVIRVVWVGATALAALGGVLTGLYFQATSWNMGGTILLLMFAAVTLGGLGTAWGALVGSIVIGLVAEMSSLVIPSDLRFAGALLILILVLLVRPQGILGRRDRIG